MSGFYCFVSGMHQKETAGSVGILHITRLKAALAKKCRLLISCSPCDGNPATDQVLVRISVNTAAWLHLRQHTLRNIEVFQDFLIPGSVMNIKKHSSGCVGVIGYMNLSLGQLPDQPGIHRSEKKLSLFCPFPGALHMIQDPFQLCSGKIGIWNQACFLSHQLRHSIFFHFFNHICSSSALPYDSRIHWFSCFFIPDNGSFSLIGDSDSMDIFCIHTNFAHCLCCH